MAENSENIEAKLCAYVEGDLDEEGRAEIERHLEAHPNHRRLLSELTSTRDLLRYLPRESAPTDLAETFNAHLERSALLDGPSVDPAAPSIHAANLLPRLLALAAIVVLGAGLGAVVYFGLPRGASNANYARVNPRPGVTTDGDVAAVAPFPETRPVAEHAERMLKAGEAPAGAVAADTRRASKNGKGGWSPDLPERFAGKPDGFGGTPAGAASQVEPVYLFICATDLSAATREVTEKLSASNVAWQPADASAQIGQQQVFPNQAVTNTNASLAFSDPARVELGNALRKKQYLQSQVPLERQYAGRLNAAAVTQPAEGYEAKRAVADATGGAYDKVISEKDAPNQVAAANAPPATPAAPTAPTAAPSAPAPQRADDVAAAQVQAPQQPQPQQQKELRQENQQQNIEPTQQAIAQLPVGAQGVTVNAGDVVGYRAKMTRDQVLNLSQSLSRPAQQVELIADDQKLQTANALLQNQQQQQQQFARQVRDETSADRSAVPEASQDLAVVTPSPATQSADQLQREQIAQADAAMSPDVNKVTGSGGGAGTSADAAKGNAPALGVRQRGPYSMKVGPDSKAAQSQAKAEAKQPAAAAAPAPAAAPATPAPTAAQPAAPASSAPGAVAAAQTPAHKQSPIASRVGGEWQVQLLQKVAPRSRLRVTVDELAGPDLSPMCEVQVAEDGTIALPKLEQRVRVEGLSRVQAEQAIHDAYKSANVVDEPTVTIEPLPPAAPVALAERPQQADLAGGVAQRAPAPARTTQPAGEPAVQSATAGATTPPTLNDQDGQPQAVPTSGPAPADEPLDVVILVQRSPVASTEPALEIAPQNAAEPNSASAPEAAKPAAPAEPAAPNAATPSVPESPAPPAPNAPAPTPPPAPSEVPAK